MRRHALSRCQNGHCRLSEATQTRSPLTEQSLFIDERRSVILISEIRNVEMGKMQPL